ncbi:hypothetical protein GCM10011575_30330 [Microlunatus endophyticus]|uniref:Uncharacterized protein n=1 Tax=Microlunatus endophyticus TaxID=1716077 RepID=A0A917W6U7_9ACTN|nr:hypothetical protein [Microlunatus endophyticus]GGL69693.1 hypothetical protein GCM10011575_30330 [Microlunatus endophyticus]
MELPTEDQQALEELYAISDMYSELLSDEHPMMFLLKVSQWFAACGVVRANDPDQPPIQDLLADFAASGLYGLRAAGYTMSRMVGNYAVSMAFDEDHEEGGVEFPYWLRYLDDAEITGCWCSYNEDDLDDVLGVGIRFADHREGTLVTITRGESVRFINAFLSFVPYAETGVNWVSSNPVTAGLSKISNASARATLKQAVANSNPIDPEGISGHADWALGWAVIQWTISLLAEAAID